jgi:hypothetical protein
MIVVVLVFPATKAVQTPFLPSPVSATKSPNCSGHRLESAQARLIFCAVTWARLGGGGGVARR